MISETLRAQALSLWREALPDLGPLGPALDRKIRAVPGDEGTLLTMAYGTLPISDTAGVPLSVIRSYGAHALRLRQESPFCRDISEEMFLHFVWYPRINSEDLTDCRAFFYEKLAPRVAGLTDEQAVLAVNRWCAEHMTYRQTDDRTESPMTAYRSGTGRCGEESVFLVTALRSVGIPARQVYCPLWAHCDDNHAWVEAFAGGRWRFLGACEPEPILDRGWFTGAAARAPLVHYRTYYDCDQGDTLVERMGSVRLYNVTARYAETFSLTVRVSGPDGRPAANAAIELDVANMAAFRPILRNCTDETGLFTAELGRSDLHVEVFQDGLSARADIRPAEDTLEISLTLAPPDEGTFHSDLTPPAPSSRNRTVLSPAQQRENAALLDSCREARAARAAVWQRPEYAAAEEPWPRFFALAAGNAPELWQFYAAHEGPERMLAGQMLEAMAEKDCRDVTFDILESHFRAALPYAGTEHFVREILDPRIGFEVLENWRPAVLAAFPPEQCAAFAADPQALMEHIRAAYPDPAGNWYPTLSMTPSAMLASGRGDEKGRRTLFTAVLRTLGVPARLDPADGSAQYWRDGRYHTVGQSGEEQPAVLELLPQDDQRAVCRADWTLSRRTEDGWQMLSCAGQEIPCRMALRPGLWRLMTTNRLPNGKQLCRVTDFAAVAGGTIRLPLKIRSAPPEDMLSCVPLDAVSLRDRDGKPVSTGEIFDRPAMLAWLEPGAEPTEHILNELLESAAAVRAQIEAGLDVAFVFRDRTALKNATLQKVLEEQRGIRVFFSGFGAAEEDLARKLFLEADTWPLAVLLDREHRARFASAGYKVGLVEMALKLADCLEA